MSYILSVTNTTQNNFQQVVVNPIPNANPEDLVWTPGGTGNTLTNTPGTIFSNLPGDQISPAYWYHGGNPPIDTNTIQLAGCDLIQATYTTRDVVSATKQKGLYEIRNSATYTITNATNASPVVITIGSTHPFQTGDYVEITEVQGNTAANGIWKITRLSNTTFSLNGSSGNGTYTSDGQAMLYHYMWDEVYTTPLGLFQAVDINTDPNPAYFQFNFLNNNSNEIKIYVEDPNIVPKIGDSFLIQRFFDAPLNSFTNTSTTDDINSVKAFFQTETYTFKITAVSSAVDPLLSGVPYVEYTLTLDKSFKPLLGEKYMLILLNRIGTGLNKELYTDTWQVHEIHRQQLLGDPYNFVGVTQPRGRKNYLYYKSSEYLGLRLLLKDVITDSKTPFIVLDLQDDIKDRIDSSNVGNVEIHLPTIMVQNEKTPLILTNANALSLPNNGILNDPTGCGNYSGLYQKYSLNLTRYGWIFYDLRIIVIDHAELACAMGYNSNRNYTLPMPTLPQGGNTVANATPDNPLNIINATNTNPIQITTASTHSFQSGDQVIISNVQGNTAANTPANSVYYAQVLTNNSFALYTDVGLTIGVDGTTSNTYIVNTGNVVGLKLAFEYFLTYRINGVHYDTLPFVETMPFNFQTNGKINNTTTGDVQVNFEALTHLVDSNILEGFEADTYEILVGRFVPDLANPYLISTIADVVRMPAQNLKTGGIQNSVHSYVFTFNDYQTQISTSTDTYDILNELPIYTVTNNLPATLFTGEGEWLVGIVKHKENVKQYRMTFTFVVPADKWNGTSNPSFEPGNSLQSFKMISEMAFLVEDSSQPNSVDEKPYIYGKVSPVIKKDNSTDLTFSVSIDF